MKSNNNDALKLAIIQSMSAMLAAVDDSDTAVSQGKAISKTKNNLRRSASKVEQKVPFQADAFQKRTPRNSCYKVDDLRALYRLTDRELLNHISAVRESKKFPGTRLCFVDRTPETKAVLAPFLSQKELSEDVNPD